ncbi:Thioredoxin-like protein Clot [Psilocybe cubensis]|uniref:Thioredoxin-like protein Clot n=1 Tax=Psilocybe cubensis TaxID=181762 RepID=A0ACB8HE20_PSICU|nr:Thioredoxin-like protein Clot [Psilocybe cubensis]KAH9486250.1 Thioredoxin-like protein Clot [Psilocybe cubensis]
MPLYIADGSIDPLSLLSVPEKFVIFYSSIVDGQMWCPVCPRLSFELIRDLISVDQDCREIDQLVQNTFSEGGPAALIVYVGDRGQWKTASNVYRQEPWKITSVPTIVRLKDGKEEARLEDPGPIQQGIAAFVKPQ